MGWLDLLKRKSSAAPAPATPTIAQEAGLSDNWQPIDVAPIRPSINPAGPPNYTQGSLPPQLGLQPDLRDTLYGGTVPVSRLMPVASLAAQNAAIAATVKQIIESTPTQGGSNVVLDMPTEFEVATSSKAGEEDITVTWAPEATGTVFSGPPADAVGFDVSFSSSGQDLVGGTAEIIGGQPSTDGEWALYTSNIVGSSYSSIPAAPWVAATGSSPAAPIYTQVIPNGATSVPVAQNFVGASAWAGNVMYFGGSVPTFVQNATGSTDATGLASIPFGGALTAGNAVLVIVNIQMVSTGTTPVTVTDTQGLTPIQLATSASGVFGGIGEGAQQTVFIMFGASNAAETINVQINAAGGVNGASITIIEITPLTPVPSRPRFRVPPAVSLANVTGILGVFNGGTGSNLAATGGTSQVLKQTTVGGAVTVARLSVTDLSTGTVGSGTNIQMATTQTGSGTVGVLATSPSIATPTFTGLTTAATLAMSGKFTKYNNINIVSNGVPAEYATVDNTTAAANIAATTAYAVPAAGAGTYRVSYYVIVKSVGTTSTLPDLKLTWTDQDNSAVQTVDFQAAAPTGNSTTTMFSGDVIMSCKASTNIQYQTGSVTAYASTGSAMVYVVRIKVEAL